MKKTLISITLLLFAGSLLGESNRLRKQFANPNFEYGPWVFWMWIL